MLTIEFGTIFFQLLAFLLLMFLVSRYAFKPLVSMMEQRTERIRSSLVEAEEQRKQAAQYIEQQQAALVEARKEAQSILATARIQQEREAAGILQGAQERADQVLAVAKAEIEQERQLVMRQLRAESIQMAVQLAIRVLDKEVDRTQHEHMLERYLKQVST